MASIWCVTPERERIALSYNDNGFWVEVKKELTIGEQRKLETAGFRGMSGFTDKQSRPDRDAEISIDWRALSFARTETYLIDWSLADENGNKLSLANKRDALENLKTGVYDVIETAIKAFVDARDEEKKVQASTRSGADGPSATSA